MTVEKVLMAMRQDSPEAAQARQREYMLEIQPWVQLYSSMVPMGGFTIRQNADGTLEERTDRWSPEQQAQIDMIEGEIARIGERFGLTRTLGDKP